MKDNIEYIVKCDSEGNVLGPLPKIEAHEDENRANITHFSTWSMVFNPKIGKYLLQRKNPKKLDKRSAGKWDMGVAGHNNFIKTSVGEKPMSFNETLPKEADEEIGMTLKMFESKKDFLEAAKKLNESIGFIFEKFHYKTEHNNEFIGLGLILTPDTELEFKDDEVVEAKWLTKEELKQFLKENDNYCAPLPMVFEKVENFRMLLMDL